MTIANVQPSQPTLEELLTIARKITRVLSPSATHCQFTIETDTAPLCEWHIWVKPYGAERNLARGSGPNLIVACQRLLASLVDLYDACRGDDDGLAALASARRLGGR